MRGPGSKGGDNVNAHLERRSDVLSSVREVGSDVARHFAYNDHCALCGVVVAEPATAPLALTVSLGKNAFVHG